MYAHADEKAIKDSDHRGLGGREVAHAHAAQNDDGRNQPPGGFTQAAPERGARQTAFKAPHAVAPCQPDGWHDQSNAHHNAWNHTGCKQGGHRRLWHQYGIDDEGNGRSEEHTSELQSLMRISYAY